MPFESKAQQRFMFGAESRGEVSKGTAKRWAKHTPDMKHLPEKKMDKTRKEAAVMVIARHLFRTGIKQANAGATSPAAPMQNLTAAQPAQPPSGAPNTQQQHEAIAKSISSVPVEQRRRAAYEHLSRHRTGALRGFAAASQPGAQQNFAKSLGSSEKAAALKPISATVDGMLRGCARLDLDERQTFQVFKKAASRPDLVGKEARGFLEMIGGL